MPKINNITWEDASFLCAIAATIYGLFTYHLTKSNRIGLTGLAIGLISTSVLITLVNHFFQITTEWALTIFVTDGIFVASALIVLIPGKERFKVRYAARTLGHLVSKVAIVVLLWAITGWCTKTMSDRLVFAGTILLMFLMDYGSYKLILYQLRLDTANENSEVFRIKAR